MKLEKIEWSRVWREEADENKKRVLLIGDSIIDGTKSMIGEALGKDISITAYVTSKALDNPWYCKELDLLIEQEEGYAAIYFNNGLHTGGLSATIYAYHYRSMIKHLQSVCPGVPVILGLSTPVAKPITNPGKANAPITPHIVYMQANQVVKDFNQEVKTLAAEFDLPVFDAYAFAEGFAPTLRTLDGYHYTQEGSLLLAGAIAATIQKAL